MAIQRTGKRPWGKREPPSGLGAAPWWKTAVIQPVPPWWVGHTDGGHPAHHIGAGPMEMFHSCLTIVFFT